MIARIVVLLFVALFAFADVLEARVAQHYQVRSFAVSLPPGATDMMPKAYVYDLTVSKNGTVWAIVGNTHALLRISRFGTASRVWVPHFPVVFAAGRSPIVYFSVSDLGPTGIAGKSVPAIGSVDEQGRYREYTLPRPFENATELSAGPDGTLWFTDSFANYVGSMAPSGRFHVLPLPPGITLPSAIRVLDDGSVLFSAQTTSNAGALFLVHSGKTRELFRAQYPSNVGLIGSNGDRFCYTIGTNYQTRLTCSTTHGERPLAFSSGDIVNARRLIVTSQNVIWFVPASISSLDDALMYVHGKTTGRIHMPGIVNGIAADRNGHVWFSSEVNLIGHITND